MTTTPNPALHTDWIFDANEAFENEINAWTIINPQYEGWPCIIHDINRTVGTHIPPVDATYTKLELRDRDTAINYIRQCAILAAIEVYKHRGS